MRRIDLMPKKKLRGAKRYLKQFHDYLHALEQSTPLKYEGYDYWNEKIWIYEKLLNNQKYTKEILNAYIKSARVFFEKNKGNDLIFTLILGRPNLFSSEVCVFYSKEYFHNFCIRDNDFQKWVSVEKGIVDDLELSIEGNYEVLNFRESIRDEDYNYDGIISIIKFL